jgi:DNA-binding transcriptional regulator YiaG
MGRPEMTLQLMKIDGRNPEGEPLHYTACGLDDVYLVNGFIRETIDGEQYTTIEDIDNLWKAIARYVVTEKKVLAPKEIKFLRGQMGYTQSELGARLRVSDQTVARWEKGKGDTIPGPADFMIRVLYLACARAQPEGGKVLDKLMEILDQLVTKDDQPCQPALFQLRMKKWRGTLASCILQPLPELAHAL